VAPPRPPEQRKADVLAQLGAPAADVWVATASPDGVAHLVPLSLAWDGEQVTLALERSSVTARNLESSGRARLGVGPTRDVVLLDAVVTSVVPVDEAPSSVADAYAAQADWDPRGNDGYVYVVLRPERIQAWREANEIAGRTLLRDGRWLV
jgi:hypothetical protein